MTNLDIRINSMTKNGKTAITNDVIEMAKELEPVVFEIVEITTGSEKQIEWAMSIQLSKAKDAVQFYKQNVGRASDRIGFTDKVEKILGMVFSHNDARYWIDNNRSDIYTMMSVETRT